MSGNLSAERLALREAAFGLAFALALSLNACQSGPPVPPGPSAAGDSMRVVILPPPRTDGPLSLEQTLGRRRSVREFASTPLAEADIGQILWAAQGVTDGEGGRTAPSAGALYPLEVYAVTASGVARYDPRAHALLPLGDGDVRPALRGAALDQECVSEAPLTLVIAAVVARTEVKYGRTRAPRYVHLEAGHAAQNVLLQAVALGLGAVPVGAFDDARVQAVLRLPADQEPLYLLCLGHPRRASW